MAWTAEDQKKYMRKYHRDNKIILNQKRKARIAANPKYKEKKKLSNKAWLNKNPGYTNNYNKERKKIDPIFRLRMNLRTRLSHAVAGRIKNGSAIKLLGCSMEHFKNTYKKILNMV
jgi:hypothetical protein